MESQLFHFLNPFPFPASRNCSCSFLLYSIKTKRHRFSGCSRFELQANANPSRRPRFTDAYMTDDYDEEDEFSFRSSLPKRVWWFDDFDDDDDDDDDVEAFGFAQGSIAFDWVFKVLQAFGWMIPAVIISLLLGTGPNTIMMTIGLPLAQSVFSLAVDALWGRPVENPRSKSRSTKRPSSRGTSRARVRKGRGSRTQTRRESQSGDYKSWVAGNNVSAKDENFGGWDELDNQVRVDTAPQMKPSEKFDEPKTEERVKVSRRLEGDAPLLMRLLIATFPFLEFWNKFL